MRKNLKPSVPVTLPTNTFAAASKSPPDQETSVLQTQLQLNRGEKIDLGGVIKKTNAKDSSVNIKPELNIETRDQDSTERVFLSLQ